VLRIAWFIKNFSLVAINIVINQLAYPGFPLGIIQALVFY
jgi:hypothetical protein